MDDVERCVVHVDHTSRAVLRHKARRPLGARRGNLCALAAPWARGRLGRRPAQQPATRPATGLAAA